MSVAENAKELPDRHDVAFAGGLGLAYVALLLRTSGSVGYSRDEGFYSYAAAAVERWFELLFVPGSQPFGRAAIDAHFGPVHEHPGLMKTLFAFSRHFLHEGLGLFPDPGTALRFPGMLMAGIAVAVLYLWGRQAAGRPAGVAAALAFALMPHVFFHAHLACLDVGAAAMWLLTSYLYFRAFSERRLGFVIAAGVVYGLFLDTKHNAWLLPFALLAHLAFVRFVEWRRKIPREGPFVPRALLSVLLLGPPVFFAVWPWIWFSTGERLAEWVRFHLGHDYYNMAFLGHTYWKPPMPRLYAWLMTLGTVPAITLVLFALGLVDSVRAALKSDDTPRLSIDSFWLIGLLVSYAPWLSTDTPIFGGTKHWITAYPFLALFASRGFSVLAARVALLHEKLGARPAAVRGALGAALAAGPAVMTIGSHPFGLSFYAPIVGGVPGAASLGMNRSFWGYTTGSLTEVVNQRAKPNASVYLHDTAVQSFELLRADGKVRPDLRGTLAISASSLALYHHEDHMQRVEYQTWVDYGTVQPVAMRLFQGVPIVWLYERPPRGPKRSTDPNAR
jgi:hypothetical protein